jgi:lysophospholipase L1-like esterase
MKHRFSLLVVVALVLSRPLQAQTNVPAPGTSASAPAVVAEVRPNTAIIPEARTNAGAIKRTDIVLQRAKESPGKYDLLFVGDSITELWERSGTNVWNKYYGKRKALNVGVGGDRTQHVLSRFERGQLDGLKPKVTVVMIGTNNSNRDDNTEAEILAGVKAVVQQIRERLPDTKILLLGIFPRGATFSVQRGKILQVNQALAKLADDKTIYYLDFGSKLIEADGSISKDMMPDKLHLSEKGYEIWAQSMESMLKKLL